MRPRPVGLGNGGDEEFYTRHFTASMRPRPVGLGNAEEIGNLADTIDQLQ